METVKLESNYRDANSLGVWVLVSFLLAGAALYFLQHYHGQQESEGKMWAARSQQATQALTLINTLDADTQSWLKSYSIEQQSSDKERIQQVKALLDAMDINALGNLDVGEAFTINERYWVGVSEQALQQSLSKAEAETALFSLLNQASSQKASTSLLTLVSLLPEHHKDFISGSNENAGAAIKRDTELLSKVSKELAIAAGTYMGVIERIQLIRDGYAGRTAELQALRFERQYDLKGMLEAVQQQASAKLEQIATGEKQATFAFYILVAVLAVIVLIRASVISRKIRSQAAQIEHNQNYMLERMKASEAGERAKTSFLSVLSYEARTALDSILGLTRLAQHTATNPDQEAKLTEVIASSTNLNGLLDDVLNFIDLELGSVTLEQEPFSPKDALALISAKYARQAKAKNILFESDIDPSLNAVYLGDQKRFYQAIDCLISNAVQYTEKGHVIFTLSVDSGQSLSGDVQRLNVKIEDTGRVLDKQEAQSLFDPFSSATFKSSRKSGGAGVRLSTAARLVNMMDGEVEVESSKGHGVTFNFYLHLGLADPSAKPVSSKSLEDTISEQQVDLQHLKVLVVEDNLTNSSLLKWILEDLEHEVMVAENGVECLNVLESNEFDLIFMDQHMPEMDGEEATKRIRARSDHKANIPIIGCTADAFQETRDLLLKAGQNDVIAKPISNDIVFEVTQQFLSGKYTKKPLPVEQDS